MKSLQWCYMTKSKLILASVKEKECTFKCSGLTIPTIFFGVFAYDINLVQCCRKVARKVLYKNVQSDALRYFCI